VQDEAALRLRSYDPRDGPLIPRRGRASKVLQHCVTVIAGDQKQDIATDMEALSDKTAATLCTSLEKVVRSVFEHIKVEQGHEIWVCHILIGDGIGTNGAAAKILWSCLVEQPLGTRVRYFLMLVRCATHSAALSTKAGVIGLLASTFGTELHDRLTGTAVRMYKYVFNDYYEEFCNSIRDWVPMDLVVCRADELGHQGSQALHLRELYSEHVIPDDMLRLLNGNIIELKHHVQGDQNPIDLRPGLVGFISQRLVRFLLSPDSHPTLSRFFTFRGCIDRMLTMSLLDMPRKAFVLKTTKPRPANQKRLSSIQSFFGHPRAPQELRRASLVMQLSGGVEALTARNVKDGEDPVLVSLNKGAAHDVVSSRLEHILGLLHHDGSLELGATASSLLGTAIDIWLRFDIFLKFPFAVCRCCRKWFSRTYLTNIFHFLHLAPEDLDVGIGLQLHALAWAQGGEMEAIRWMTADHVQAFLEQVCSAGLCTSLSAERRHAEAKQWESTKVTHIATASRDLQCARFSKQREYQALKIHEAERHLRRLRKVRTTSLAWEHDCLRPEGLQHGGLRGDAGNDRTRGRAARIFAQENADYLGAQKRILLESAERDLQQLLQACHVPITRAQWAEWLDRNIGEFREQMKTAGEVRRQKSHRVRCRAGLPKPRRLEPVVVKRTLNSQWAKNLAGRIGWHYGESRDNPVRSTILLKAWAMYDDEQDEGEKTKRQQPSAAISSYKQPVAD